MQDRDVIELKTVIEESQVLAFLGGAGVSTASGLPDFRSEASVSYAKKRFGYGPETLLSHDFFMEHTGTFYEYYKAALLLPVRPNAAHYALAELGRRGKLNAVVTQNVDGLHQRAGSKRVYPLHGSVEDNRCMGCNQYFTADFIRACPGVPRCPDCGGLIKPEVVLYGEPLDEYIWRGARAAVSSADTLMVAGTSLVVYPAAALLEYFPGKRLVLINTDKEKTPFDAEACLILHERVEILLPACL